MLSLAVRDLVLLDLNTSRSTLPVVSLYCFRGFTQYTCLATLSDIQRRLIPEGFPYKIPYLSTVINMILCTQPL